MTFNWSGQSGTPSYVWGGGDGVNMYVYQPSNFSVSYAGSAGSAGSAGYATYAGSAGSAPANGGYATSAGYAAYAGSAPANGGSATYATGARRLYRSDNAVDPYNVQSWWDGSYWFLKGYNDSTYHAGVKVAYSDSAGYASYAGSAGSAPANGGYADSAGYAGYAGGAGTATYLSGTQQTNIIIGAYSSLWMSGYSDPGRCGSFVCRSGGTGDGNLAGMSFWNDSYAIKLGVRDDGTFGLGGWSSTNWRWYSAPNGDMVAAGNVAAYSDPRLKENFEIVKNPFEILNALDGGTFNWKHGISHIECKAGNKDYGILADQVEAVMPEIVTDSIEIDGEKYKTVAYEKLIPVLIEAIKVLEKRVAELEAR
jgi:hypothetical protein